jgi:two-component system phosphate regulon sensor histidine kinase PhoR
VAQLLEEGWKAGKALERECVLFTPEERIFSVRVSPHLGPQGQAEGAVVLFLDVTRERRLERLRSEFVANASHELKTPLTAIRAALETLDEGALEDQAVNREFLSKALRHTERLSALIEDLLSLSAIEERQRTGRVEALQSASLVQACQVSYGIVEAKYQAKKLRFSQDLPAGLPSVRLDESSLVQVFTNILDNAGKYSPPGGEVSVTARSGSGLVELRISDQGPGIPQADLPRLFERFYRVDKARSRELGGTGLGLSIVKHLVEGAGGSVAVESEPGRGSTFSFHLPAA